jgi:hypothetical protein
LPEFTGVSNRKAFSLCKIFELQAASRKTGIILYTISCMHCMTTSLSQGGMGLGAMWGEQRALQFLKSAGFTDIEIRTLEHDIQNNY